MSLLQAIKETEESLIKLLNAKRSGIDDRTGKGSATERIIDKQLLIPHVPPGFRSTKGAVVETSNLNAQSPCLGTPIKL